MFHHLVLMRMRMVVRFALGRQDKIWVAKTATTAAARLQALEKSLKAAEAKNLF